MENRPVICAAIKHKKSNQIVCGVRHFDKIMSQAATIINPCDGGSIWEQGFVDSYGEFLDRKQALARARECEQRLINTDKEWFKDELFSENLY